MPKGPTGADRILRPSGQGRAWLLASAALPVLPLGVALAYASEKAAVVLAVAYLLALVLRVRRVRVVIEGQTITVHNRWWTYRAGTSDVIEFASRCVLGQGPSAITMHTARSMGRRPRIMLEATVTGGTPPEVARSNEHRSVLRRSCPTAHVLDSF